MAIDECTAGEGSMGFPTRKTASTWIRKGGVGRRGRVG
jgi:hypothetical protein